MPFIYLLTPYTALFSTPGGRLAGLAFVLALKAFTVIVAFPAVTILLTNCCPSLRILGTLNGFVTMFSGIGRAIGPASTGLAFTWGVEHGYIVTAYYFLAFIAVCGAIPVFFVVEGDGPTATAENSDDERDDSQRSGSVLLSDTYEDAIDDTSDEESEPDAPLMGRSKQRSYEPIKTNEQET